MNCSEFAAVARDFAHGQWLGARERVRAETHVTECADCRALLDREKALSAGLGALAASSIAEAPSAAVERVLLARFRVQHRRRQLPAWLAAAAAVLVAAILTLWSRAISPAQPSVARREVMTEFVPLSYAPALRADEPGQLVRIRVPRSELVRFGLPVTLEGRAQTVQADVLLGEDGIARAIRFVR